MDFRFRWIENTIVYKFILVRSSSSSRRSRDDQQQQQQEDQTVPTVLTSDSNHLTELVTLPALLSTLRGAGEVDAVSISRRGQRRRTNSESSCCEDGKPGVMNSSVDVGVTTVHWTQQVSSSCLWSTDLSVVLNVFGLLVAGGGRANTRTEKGFVVWLGGFAVQTGNIASYKRFYLDGSNLRGWMAFA